MVYKKFLNKKIVTNLTIFNYLNINNLYCSDDLVFKEQTIFINIDGKFYLNGNDITIKKNKELKIEDIINYDFYSVNSEGILDNEDKLNLDNNVQQIKKKSIINIDGDIFDNNIVNDNSNAIKIQIEPRKINSNIYIVIKNTHENKTDKSLIYTLTDSEYNLNDIETDTEENFVKSLINIFGNIESTEGEVVLNTIYDFENNYIIDFNEDLNIKIFNKYNIKDGEILENEKFTKKALECLKNGFKDDLDFTIVFNKLIDYEINNIKLKYDYEKKLHKKLKNVENLKEKINDLLKKRDDMISLEDIQTLIKNSSDENLKKTEIDTKGNTKYNNEDEINLEITKIDDSFLEDKKATIKFVIDENKKDKLRISDGKKDGKKDIEITFNDTINENTKIIDYITNNLKLDKTKCKVVKGTNPIGADDKFADSETYTILFTDKVEGYVEELKEDDIQISVEFKVNDSTKLKLNESNKTCDIVLTESNCGITDFLNKLNSKYNGIKDNGVIISIKEDGNNTELLNNNTYKCEKNKKYIITLGKKINNLVEEKITETPKKDKDKDKDEVEEKKNEEINNNINSNNNNTNSSLNKGVNDKDKKGYKCCCRK